MKTAPALLWFSALGLAARADVVSTFDTGLDGWSGAVPAFQHTWGATGGHPGGYADFLDQDSGAGWLNAPAAFLGDWSALSGVGSLRWDSIVFDEGFAPSPIPFEIEISGSGITASFTTTVGDATWYSWVTTTVPLDASLWTVSGGSWASLLGNVQSLSVKVERVSNAGTSAPSHPGDHCGFDNFAQIVPAPGAGVLILAGAGLMHTRRRSRRREDRERAGSPKIRACPDLAGAPAIHPPIS